MEKNYFLTLNQVKCEIEKKNWLNYISWSDAWAEVKKRHPEATYRKIKNPIDGSYLFRSGTGGSVECEVTIKWITHCADLAITDFKNQEIKYESIESTDIQNTLQRAFAKAIAMHGIWLYVYRGEDIPEEVKDLKPYKKSLFKDLQDAFNSGGSELAQQTYREQELEYDINSFIVEKMKKLWQIYKENQNITDEDIDSIWKDSEAVKKQALRQ